MSYESAPTPSEVPHPLVQAEQVIDDALRYGSHAVDTAQSIVDNASRFNAGAELEAEDIIEKAYAADPGAAALEEARQVVDNSLDNFSKLSLADETPEIPEGFDPILAEEIKGLFAVKSPEEQAEKVFNETEAAMWHGGEVDHIRGGVKLPHASLKPLGKTVKEYRTRIGAGKYDTSEDTSALRERLIRSHYVALNKTERTKFSDYHKEWNSPK